MLSTLGKTSKQRGRKSIFLAGDFNIDLLTIDNASTDLLHCLQSHSFIPAISKPTRITNTSSTLIDNIFINNTQWLNTSAILHCDLSDHLPILLRVKIGIRSHKTSRDSKFIHTRDYDSKNQQSFIDALSAEKWETIFTLLIGKCLSKIVV